MISNRFSKANNPYVPDYDPTQETSNVIRKRVNVKLVNDKAKLSKLTASPSFDSFRIFSQELSAVNMRKTKLKPFNLCWVYYPGCFKGLMYDFHYNDMKQKYASKAKLLFTDTDSLFYEVRTTDIYQDMLEDTNLFDTSEYRPPTL